MKTKTCSRCDEEKPLSEYYRDKSKKDGRRSHCKKCELEDRSKPENKEWHKQYMKEWNSRPEVKERIRCRKLQKNYGITLDEYNEMCYDQNGCCAICGKHSLETGTLCVDHCHDSGAVRGLLCGKCNKAIGLLDDDPDTLGRAKEYLKKHKK